MALDDMGLASNWQVCKGSSEPNYIWIKWNAKYEVGDVKLLPLFLGLKELFAIILTIGMQKKCS